MNNVTIDDLIIAQKKLKKYCIFHFVSLIVVLLFAITMFIFLSFGAVDIFMYMLGIFVFLLCFTFFYRPDKRQRKNYTEMYKKYFIYNILSKTCNHLEFNEKNGIPYSVIYESNIIVKSSEYYSNNLISGTYKNVQFDVADIYLKNYHFRRGYISKSIIDDLPNTERNTHYDKYVIDDIGNFAYSHLLTGNWMVITLDKTFKEKFSIVRNKFSNIKRNNKKIDNDYSKKYSVIYEGQNNIDSYITPFLIDKIDKLQQRTGSNILISFNDNNIHIGFDSFANFFNPPKQTNIMENNYYNDLLENTRLIFDIVDYIQNNEVYFK